MTLRTETTLAGYARAAVDLRARMVDYHRSPLSQDRLHAFLGSRLADHDGEPSPETVDALRRVTSMPWQHGEPYVAAPAMTAIVAAAAQALDLTGEVLPDDIAPDNGGVVSA